MTSLCISFGLTRYWIVIMLTSSLLDTESSFYFASEQILRKLLLLLLRLHQLLQGPGQWRRLPLGQRPLLL